VVLFSAQPRPGLTGTIADLEIAELTTAESLERLRPEWSALWGRCPTSTPFQAPEWLIPWWRHIAEGELWTLAVRHGGRLIGLAPLYIYIKPGASVREVFPVGIATTDYLDGLFEPPFAACGAAAVLGFLDANCQRWDVCDLQQLRPESPLLTAPLPEGWRDEVAAQDTCPVLELPATTANLTTVMSRRLSKDLRYSWRRLEKLGPVRFETADRNNLDELIESLLHLHGARWSARGEAGVLSHDVVQRAHRETMPALLSLDLLRLYALRVSGRIVASFYGFSHVTAGKRRAYFYLSGFDPALAHLSLGGLIIDHAVRAAIHEGAAEFDFLRGAEAYKYRWGARDRFTYRRRLWHQKANIGRLRANRNVVHERRRSRYFG
jgi:CelD/BcsL family acetyltransferase involved in cellulose biosynthesis